jgi:hypothetical protein
MDLQSLLRKIPGVSGAANQLDTIRAEFLAIPAQTQANESTLARVRALTNDATEAQTIATLQAQAASVKSGFASVLGQFQHFDDLRRAGATTGELVAAGTSLAVAAQGVKRSSDSLTSRVAPLAAKYGQASPVVHSGAGPALAILAAAGLVMVFVLRPRRRGRR